MKKRLILIITFITLILITTAILIRTCGNEQSLVVVDERWLNRHLDEVVLLDIRKEESYAQGHIPQALSIDFKYWNTTKDGVQGLLPEESYIETLIQNAGIDETSHVVISSGQEKPYDFSAAARIYWTLKVSRLTNLSILNGGTKAWIDGELPLITEKTPLPTPSNYTIGTYDRTYITDDVSVLNSLNNDEVTILDVRPEALYKGDASHPANTTTGTIEGSKNIPFRDFISEDQKLYPKKYLKKLIDEHEALKREQTIITFCNLGYGSAVEWFVFSEIFGRDSCLYDGSFAEWSKKGLPTQNKQDNNAPNENPE